MAHPLRTYSPSQSNQSFLQETLSKAYSGLERKKKEETAISLTNKTEKKAIGNQTLLK